MQITIIVKRFPDYIIGLLLASYPFLCGIDDGLGVLSLVVAGVLGAAVRLWRDSFCVTVGDALAGMCVLWIAWSYLISSRGLIMAERIDEFVGLCVVWFVVRNVGDVKRIVQFVLLGALLQAALCGAQLAGVAVSGHSLFSFTGSFRNPGPLAGFLAVTLFVYPYLWRGRGRIWLALGFLATLVLIVLSGSRASWVAVCVGAAVCLLPRLNMRTVAVSGIAAIALCAGSYFLRPASADGRVLIWKASASLFAEEPVCGNGPGAFQREYMYHQSGYFEDKLMSAESLLADNVAYAFSEPVRVLCEYGAVGFLVFGALIVCLIAGVRNRFVRAGFVAWLVFGFFSYPASVYPLRLLFVVLAAMLACDSRTLRVVAPKMPLRIGAIAGLVLFVAVATRNYVDPRTTSDPDHLHYRAELLYKEKKYDEAIPVFEQAARIAPSSLLLVNLGKCYYAVGRTTEAEECLVTAVGMTPAYATPAYELFDFYRREGRMTEALHWANYLVDRKFKATNSATLFARKEARDYINATAEHGGSGR